MQNLTLQDFKTKVYDYENEKAWKFKGSRPAIIDFYADWCGPCKRLSPVLEELQTTHEGNLDVYKVDTEKEQELAAMFGIRSIPSLLFIPLGEEPQMVTGAVPREALDEAVRDVLKIGENPT